MKRYLIELAAAEKTRNTALYYSNVYSGSIGALANKRIERALSYNATALMTDHEAAGVIIKAYTDAVEHVKNAAEQYYYYIEKYSNGSISAENLKKAVGYYNEGNADTLTGKAIVEYIGKAPETDIEKAAIMDTVLWAG